MEDTEEEEAHGDLCEGNLDLIHDSHSLEILLLLDLNRALERVPNLIESSDGGKREVPDISTEAIADH